MPIDLWGRFFRPPQQPVVVVPRIADLRELAGQRRRMIAMLETYGWYVERRNDGADRAVPARAARRGLSRPFVAIPATLQSVQQIHNLQTALQAIGTYDDDGL